VTADSAGNFVVVWESYPQDGSSTGIIGQRYASSGAPLGSEFRVNTNTTDSSIRPSVAADTLGNFVVVWETLFQGPTLIDVFGQRYDSSGVPQGPEFRVNNVTGASQFIGVVAADSSGNFVVVWNSFAQDGSGVGVFGQRYGRIVPVELMQFGVE
jgi:hypothetical protein